MGYSKIYNESKSHNLLRYVAKFPLPLLSRFAKASYSRRQDVARLNPNLYKYVTMLCHVNIVYNLIFCHKIHVTSSFFIRD